MADEYPGGQSALPHTYFLVVDETRDGAFLIRYSSNAEFAGDTWHRNLVEARAQAQDEFGELVWEQASADAQPVDEFARAILLKRKQDDSRAR